MLTDEQFDALAELLELIDGIEAHYDSEWAGEDIP